MAALRGRARDRLMRALDVAVAATGLIVLAPMLALVAAAIVATMRMPVLFRQERTGLGEQTFALVKFRTMRAARAGEDSPEHDDARLTPLGRVLRATSIDELPTLWNVLVGDMALVGPRPLPVRYLERYGPRHRRRHEVRPGITGWAQVNGRNALTWAQKFDLDVWYVDHRSVAFDLRIIVRTIPAVLRRSGVAQPGHATMPEFTGDGS